MRGTVRAYRTPYGGLDGVAARFGSIVVRYKDHNLARNIFIAGYFADMTEITVDDVRRDWIGDRHIVRIDDGDSEHEVALILSINAPQRSRRIFVNGPNLTCDHLRAWAWRNLALSRTA